MIFTQRGPRQQASYKNGTQGILLGVDATYSTYLASKHSVLCASHVDSPWPEPLSRVVFGYVEDVQKQRHSVGFGVTYMRLLAQVCGQQICQAKGIPFPLFHQMVVLSLSTTLHSRDIVHFLLSQSLFSMIIL